MNLSGKSGYLLIGTGIIHNTIGIIMGKNVLVQIIDAGFVNSINAEMDRNAIFWFLFSGVMMMILGKLMQDYMTELKKTLPVSLGYYLLALSLVGCVMMPVSGFWIVVPQALLIVMNGKRKTSLASSY